MITLARILATLALLVPASSHAEVVDPFDISIYGTQSGGGALATDYDFAQATVVSESLCAGGQCLYTSTDPGFISRADGTGAVQPLASGTEVALEIVALDDGVTVKVDAVVLASPGEMAVLGTAPSLHNHPQWQVTRPEGERGTYAVSFRLAATSAGASYADSPVYTLLLTNGSPPQPTPRPTATPVSSPSPAPSPTSAAAPRGAPRAIGDQALLYYDAREGFTTFLNLVNDSDRALEVALVLYPGSGAAALERSVSLPPHGTRTLDVGSLVGAGLGAEAGLAAATARDSAGNAIVSRAIGGSFTVANLQTQSAWGAPALARVARAASGPATLPAIATPIDGRAVVLEQLVPSELELAVYYDPETLEPASAGGNQLAFVSFADLADGQAGLAAASTTWEVQTTRRDGSALPLTRHETSGVVVSDLAAIGGTGVAGAAGAMRIRALGTRANRWAYFAESLGTFATGYALPAIDTDLGDGSASPAGVDLAPPRGRGDQLLFPYDSREGHTTFLNLHNGGASPRVLRVVFYSPDLSPVFQIEESLGAGASRTIDVGALREGGLVPQVGIATATAAAEGNLVTSGALAGSFTIANLGTASAWGGPAAARRARAPSGAFPAEGSAVDGVEVAWEAFATPRADLAVFYDPLSLAPAELGGNQLVLVSFDDAPSGLVAAQTRWRARVTRNDGGVVVDRILELSGVTLDDIVALAGRGAEGQAGRLVLEPQDGSARNRIAFFVQSLGTFATGYLLPAAAPVGP